MNPDRLVLPAVRWIGQRPRVSAALFRFARYDPFDPRRVSWPTIPAGANVALMIGAANRDVRRWPDADQLRIDRPDPRPISFGHGIHHCLGAALTRLEMRAALPAFLDRFGDYTVDPASLTWKQSNTLRGPTTLRVRPGPRYPSSQTDVAARR